MASDEDEIRRVRRSEQRRGGKKPSFDEDKAERAAEVRNSNLKLLRAMTWDDFQTALNALGLQPGTEGYKDLVKVWTQYCRDQKTERPSRQRREKP